MLSVHIPWDVDEYYSNNIKGGRDKKIIQFPNPQFGSQSKPLTFVDSKGRIVLWYLPGLLLQEQQVQPSVQTYSTYFKIRHATAAISPLL